MSTYRRQAYAFPTETGWAVEVWDETGQASYLPIPGATTETDALRRLAPMEQHAYVDTLFLAEDIDQANANMAGRR